jgi:hypothetical protein
MTSIPTHDPNHENRIVVIRQAVGWEVREEQGPVILRSQTVKDWHRVERTMQSFRMLPFRPEDR